MIYLDHHAATPMPSAVRDAMREAADQAWANPSSVHGAGRASRAWLEGAREQVAAALGALASDVVLTGGGTEACNLGVHGLASHATRIVTTEVEHPAVAESIAHWQRQGRPVVTLSVRGGSAPSPEMLAPHLDASTVLAVQWVNHETGTVFPVAQYGAMARARGARCFVDATQALGKFPIDVARLEVDVIAVGAQKLGGPPSAGACWVRRGVELSRWFHGGGQERGRRPGTLDVVSMVGFGAACGLVGERLAAQPRIAELRDRIEHALIERGAVVNGVEPRAATVSNLSFAGWEGPILVAALDLEGVCVSAGAACSSGAPEPSAVLRAMYPDEQWRARSAVRLSLGLETTERDIIMALQCFERVLSRGPAKS